MPLATSEYLNTVVAWQGTSFTLRITKKVAKSLMTLGFPSNHPPVLFPPLFYSIAEVTFLLFLFFFSPNYYFLIYCVEAGCFFALKVWNAQKAGASAVLVADDVEEPLITMDTPEEDGSSAKYVENITIPSALVGKSFAQKLKDDIIVGDMVNVNLDWREAVPHPDDRVEYELWTNSNDECG